MNVIAILFIIGLVFLGFEVVIPGAILGILGGLALLAGVIVAFFSFGVAGGLGAFGIAVVLLGIMLTLEFVVLPRTPFGRRLFLRSAISATSQPAPGDAGLIGQTAEAVTPLVPSGVVSIGGRRYEAFSPSTPTPSWARR